MNNNYITTVNIWEEDYMKGTNSKMLLKNKIFLSTKEADIFLNDFFPENKFDRRHCGWVKSSNGIFMGIYVIRSKNERRQYAVKLEVEARP